MTNCKICGNDTEGKTRAKKYCPNCLRLRLNAYKQSWRKANPGKVAAINERYKRKKELLG